MQDVPRELRLNPSKTSSDAQIFQESQEFQDIGGITRTIRKASINSPQPPHYNNTKKHSLLQKMSPWLTPSSQPTEENTVDEEFL